MGDGPDIIWESKLDGRYDCTVKGIPGKTHTGLLEVVDGEDLIYSQEVSLSYGAIFGPDVADVAKWEELCVGAVDAQKGD